MGDVKIEMSNNNDDTMGRKEKNEKKNTLSTLREHLLKLNTGAATSSSGEMWPGARNALIGLTTTQGFQVKAETLPQTACCEL